MAVEGGHRRRTGLSLISLEKKRGKDGRVKLSRETCFIYIPRKGYFKKENSLSTTIFQGVCIFIVVFQLLGSVTWPNYCVYIYIYNINWVSRNYRKEWLDFERAHYIIASHCLHLFFGTWPKQKPWEKETRLRQREDFLRCPSLGGYLIQASGTWWFGATRNVAKVVFVGFNFQGEHLDPMRSRAISWGSVFGL